MTILALSCKSCSVYSGAQQSAEFDLEIDALLQNIQMGFMNTAHCLVRTKKKQLFTYWRNLFLRLVLKWTQTLQILDRSY